MEAQRASQPPILPSDPVPPKVETHTQDSSQEPKFGASRSPFQPEPSSQFFPKDPVDFPKQETITSSQVQPQFHQSKISSQIHAPVEPAKSEIPLANSLLAQQSTVDTRKSLKPEPVPEELLRSDVQPIHLTASQISDSQALPSQKSPYTWTKEEVYLYFSNHDQFRVSHLASF